MVVEHSVGKIRGSQAIVVGMGHDQKDVSFETFIWRWIRRRHVRLCENQW
jgi:hypothetical protein